ncbi:MAG TPA: valine--tRNA ligase [Gemmatimonadaceae bacterium]|nr:valine--tRNA ligase [Gemmatimonadaceae bacterium]
MTAPKDTTSLAERYDPGATEAALYEAWEKAGVHRADATRSLRVGGPKRPFVMVIPPPNVTAVLHMGHGLNDSVQDVIMRWRRMAGDEALWVPGTDHAGIATQNVVEKLLAAEGKTRFDVGRDAFVERTKQFVAETGGAILRQLRALGCSCDWTRTAYTFSPELSRAVREAFVTLYEKGLVYRGHRVIHWCPRCLTSLSDEEAEFHDESGMLYHVRYPVVGSADESIVIATTRPETMLADVAVAVHPEDERYTHLVGKRVMLPIVNIEIPVIADTYVDREFGTGALKITPAHDANDFDVGQRHGLASPVVIDAEGRMNPGPEAGTRIPADIVGLDRFDARKRIAKMLADSGALVDKESRAHRVRRCYRCNTIVEPRLSDQWFVKMKPLAEPALAAVRSGSVRVLPERWEAVYINWLEGIRDWNISRQIWWGHRVPVWYAADGTVHVRRDDPTLEEVQRLGLRQDTDVFDTWFSSALWPLSTLGWPDTSAQDFRAFYPTDVLVTAPEILFFWVARMMFFGYAFAEQEPFHTVYLHGTVRDTQHRKMSKSLGNGIDPLDVIKLYGADALRWTVIAGLGMGTDVILDPADLEKSFAPGRNFVTKLWNIGRFLLQNIGDTTPPALSSIDTSQLASADAWILSRLDAAIAECDAALGPSRPESGAWPAGERFRGMRLDEYAEAARRFAWNELADWYVEAVKPRLLSPGNDGNVARAVLLHVYDHALRLLHPIVPFITESLWQKLPGRPAGAFLARAAWPTVRGGWSTNAREFERVQELVAGIRQIRGDYNVAPSVPTPAVLVGADDLAGALEANRAFVERMSRSPVAVAPSAPAGPAAHVVLRGGGELVLPLAGIVDVAKEQARVSEELSSLEKQLKSLEGRLANTGFVAKAPPAIVEAERRKADEWRARREQLAAKHRALGGT